MYFRSGFSDSNNATNSGVCCTAATNSGEAHSTSSASDVTALRRLSENLASIFEANKGGFDFFSDAKIVAGDGREFGVHRCILAARSVFFKNAFAGGGMLRLKEVAKDYDVGFEALGSVLSYLYSGRVKALGEGESGVCVCVDDQCSHFGCRPAVDFFVQLLYASSTFHIYELVSLYQGHLLDILDKVAIDDILVVLSIANICGKACDTLQARCTEIIVKSNFDITTLEKALPQHVVKQIMQKRKQLGMEMPEIFNIPDKHVNRIHRALDSDDVELVRLLLKEGHTTLDDAHALHYAVAYCDVKTTAELLDLGLADVNQKNQRGYSVLHVAAMRKEPKIIVSLLTKGAQPSDLTLDGRKALQISKRLTKAVDYYKATEEGKVSCNDRLCIEILEQAERREPLHGEASLSLAMAGDDLRMKLLYLENRVGLAKVLFPMEAKVIMDIAQVDGTSEFPSTDIYCPYMLDHQRTTVDLNDAPFRMKEEHLVRLRALSRTVELGKRFFPRCSEVLNKIMDADDLSQLTCMGDDSPEDRLWKRRRYEELQEVLNKVFNEDKEEFDRSAMSSSSSSSSIGVVRPNGHGKLAMKN
ncbi:BTB/POZ domain and ankyrin repeat-containing protein NPR1-like [Abrus precatorius]|uniref:BTB/POZ domain and ankyrin repeat-containing protein NPR1-like n=1 Tax=Abrus precatorius TaxID=3816 RepID=A0A8B8K4X2_ABRPR|nr:BTB/POZ domain and ankyrin repeat-containing protein NPR1-like [Abrus precatorius]